MFARHAYCLGRLLIIAFYSVPLAALAANNQSLSKDQDHIHHHVAPSADMDRTVVANLSEGQTDHLAAASLAKLLKLAQQAIPANDLIITLLDQGMERLRQGDPVSALAFYEEAARLGSGAAAVLGARMISPLVQDRPDLPTDPVRTFELYVLADQLGTIDALPELQALEAWARKHAERGDPNAQAVIERMKILEEPETQ